jgi:hypothetical protein
MNMMKIIGTYRAPKIKCIFFILSFDEKICKPRCYPLSQQEIKWIEAFLGIRSSTESTQSRKNLRWRVLTLLEKDFWLIIQYLQEKTWPLTALEKFAFNLDLPSINICRPPVSSISNSSFETPRKLGMIPDEDIVEVFI